MRMKKTFFLYENEHEGTTASHSSIFEGKWFCPTVIIIIIIAHNVRVLSFFSFFRVVICDTTGASDRLTGVLAVGTAAVSSFLRSLL